MDPRGNVYCTAIAHGPCDSCGDVVLRASHHIHIYYPAKGGSDVLCGQCWGVIVVACKPVLEACEGIGVGPYYSEVREALDNLRVAVIAQSVMPLD